MTQNKKLLSGEATSQYLGRFQFRLLDAMMELDATLSMLEAQASPEMPNEEYALAEISEEAYQWLESSRLIANKVWSILGDQEREIIMEKRNTITAFYNLE